MLRPTVAGWWTALTLTGFNGMLLTVVALRPHWIEDFSGLDPDSGDGSAEWGLVALAAVSLVTLLLVSGWEWRGLRRSASPSSTLIVAAE